MVSGFLLCEVALLEQLMLRTLQPSFLALGGWRLPLLFSLCLRAFMSSPLVAMLVFILNLLLLPVPLTHASCGRSCSTSTLHSMNVLPVLPATVEDSEDEGEAVFGPDTPCPETEFEPNVTTAPTATEPWDDLSRALARLWDDGQELTVYMMASYLRSRLLVCSPEMREVLRQATSLIRPYDDGARRPHLPPWWRIWLDALLERWAARLRELRTAHNLEDGDVAGLMQLGAGPWRSELWRGLLLQLRDYPGGIQGVVARRIRQWLKQQLDDMAPGFMLILKRKTT